MIYDFQKKEGTYVRLLLKQGGIQRNDQLDSRDSNLLRNGPASRDHRWRECGLRGGAESC